MNRKNKKQPYETFSERLDRMEAVCLRLSAMMDRLERQAKIDDKLTEILDNARQMHDESCAMLYRTTGNGRHLHILKGGGDEEEA